MGKQAPAPLPEVTPPPGGPVKANLKQAVPIDFFACTWESAQDEVRRQRECDWWVYDWPDVDHQWLFGSPYSPLARIYYQHVIAAIEHDVNQAYSQCEASHLAPTLQPSSGMRIMVSSRLDGGGARSRSVQRHGIQERLSVQFSNSVTRPPTTCPMLPRELFAEPVDFDYVMYGPGDGNFQWDWRDQQQQGEPDPYFELYGRRLSFYGRNFPYIGTLYLVMKNVADLRVRFQGRPIPPAAADRVDPAQPLSYRVSTGRGYLNIAAVIEVTHLESGQIWYRNIFSDDYLVGQMNPLDFWPDEWSQMSMDADGAIRHRNAECFCRHLHILEPELIGLPKRGNYRLRCILLAYGYDTLNRTVSSDAAGLGYQLMTSRLLRLSRMPALITYTPGMTTGIIPPFEVTYTCNPVIKEGILFDAVFDMKNITTFRFVIKVGNTFDFAVGLVVQAVFWQAWVRLEPGETKYLAGGVSISGMSNWYAYPLHPQSPDYGWERSWGSAYISMNNGQCSIPFRLFLTAPDNPETTPANMPAKKATMTWDWDLAGFGPQYEPVWGAIKRYAYDGRYDYNYAFAHYNPYVVAIKTIDRSITKPSHQPLIDPATYFVTGYQTPIGSSSNGWWARPWPGYIGWDAGGSVRCNAEQLTWNGSQYVWAPVEAVQFSLTRAMMQQVAAMLGVTEYVVMDGDDIRWFVPVTYSPPTYPESFSNVLWIDRFYTRAGALIDDAAMRSAFQTVISNNAASWPNYRNIVIHPSVRFGSFLDKGGFEVGDYLLGPNGDMVEVGSLADLGSVSTRFLYYIKPEFR